MMDILNTLIDNGTASIVGAAVYAVANTVVKKSKLKADDIVIDIIWSGLKNFLSPKSKT